MKLERVRIRNFRCFVDVDVALADGTLVVGANNSGKSTLVEAIRLLFVREDRFGTEMSYEEAASRAIEARRPNPSLQQLLDGAAPKGPPVLIRAEVGDLSPEQTAQWLPILINQRLVIGVSIDDGDASPVARAVMNDAAVEFFAIAAKLRRGEDHPTDLELPGLIESWRRWMVETLNPLAVDEEWWLTWEVLEEFIYQEAWPEPYPEPGSRFRVPQSHSLAYVRSRGAERDSARRASSHPHGTCNRRVDRVPTRLAGTP